MDDHSPYSVTNTAALAPGVDWLTRSPNGPFIDTGKDVEFASRGRLYLSVETIREMAEIAGLFAVADGDAAKKYDIAWEAGRKAGVEENLHGHLDRIAAELDAAVDAVRRALVPAGPVEEEPAGEPAAEPVEQRTEPASVDTPESKPARTRRSAGQGNGTPLIVGFADVPAGPSHESFGI